MNKNSGFTLVEILVVIMILGILMSITIPAVVEAISGGQGVKCSKNLKSLGDAAVVHGQKYGGPNMNQPTDIGKAFWKRLCAKGSNVLGIPDDDYTQAIFHCAIRQTSGNEVRFRGPGDKIGNLRASDPVGCDDEPHKDRDTDSGSVLKRDSSVLIMTGTEWADAHNKCKD